MSQPTPEIDISSLNDGYLHLIVRYWTLPELFTGAADKNQGCDGDQSSVRSSPD